MSMILPGASRIDSRCRVSARRANRHEAPAARYGQSLFHFAVLVEHPLHLRVGRERVDRKMAEVPLWATRGQGRVVLLAEPQRQQSGAEGNRTLYLLHAMQALSQMSYGP